MQMWSDNWLATSLALDYIKTLYDCTRWKICNNFI